MINSNHAINDAAKTAKRGKLLESGWNPESRKVSYIFKMTFGNSIKTRSNFRHLSCIFLAVIFLFTLETNAQDAPMSAQNLHQWGSVSLFHGLPSDKVRAVVQDTNGVMWFGTDNGLARFDGRRVQAVGLNIPTAEKIFALEMTSDGTLWIGTDQGAARIEKGIVFPVKETFGNAVADIEITNEGRIILAAASGQVFEYFKDATVKTFLSNPLFEETDETSNQATSLITDGQNFLLGTLGRSLVSVRESGAYEIFAEPRPYFITALERGNNGDLWIGTQANVNSGGLFLATDISQPQNINIETGTISALAAVERNDLWAGTTERGAFLLRNSEEIRHFTFENTAGGLLSNNIYAIFIDRESVVWFGTDRGVCRFDARSPRNETLSEDGNTNFVRTIFQKENGEILIGTNRGLFSDKNGERRLINGFERASIYSIAENGGNIYVGTSRALYTSDEQLILDEPIRTLENFQGKTYAAVYGRGLSQIKGAGTSLIFPNELVTALYNDNDENLWIGTAKDGVFLFDGKQVKQESPFDSLKNTVIRDIAKDAGGNVWFATERGLFLFQNLELIPIAENFDVWQIILDENEVWGATDGRGVIHLKADANFGWLVTFLDAEQGLPSQKTFTLMKPADSENLLIGTNRGITRYTPNELAPTLQTTRIVSQRLHSPEELVDGINLEYPQNSLSLEITALSNRTFPEQFQYGFILKDKQDNIIKQNISAEEQILMEDLEPGKYRVEVIAYGKDLLASAPLKFEFTVAAAPFPLTTTALAVLLAIAAIALVLVFVERKRLRSTNRELALARFDLANEAERERRRIARDLHDQTLADLRSLMLVSDKFTVGESEEMKGEFRQEIESVSEEIRRICEDLSPSVLENVGLTAALEFLLGHTLLQSNEKFTYKFTAEDNLEEHIEFPPNVQMQIYRIAQEVLNNISRHSHAKIVRMKAAAPDKKEFVITIENDGSEFDAEAAKKGRGLANIRTRASLIEAIVEWQKRENGGMIFTLRKSF